MFSQTWRHRLQISILAILTFSLSLGLFLFLKDGDKSCAIQLTTFEEFAYKDWAVVEAFDHYYRTDCMFVIMKVEPLPETIAGYPGALYQANISIAARRSLVIANDYRIVRFQVVHDMNEAREVANQFLAEMKGIGLSVGNVW